MLVYPETDRARWARMQRFKMEPGDRFWNFSGGGGGYGDPLERDPARVVEDVRDAYVSIAAARDVYGIVIDADGVPHPTEARSAHQPMSTSPAEPEREATSG
jgi:N-methylhydantoinase B